MHRQDAFDLLERGRLGERLKAARYFADHAIPEDAARLRTALQAENVPWVTRALERACERAESPVLPEVRAAGAQPDEVEDLDVEVVERIRTEAVRESTSLLIHELEKHVGILRLVAGKEISGFAESETRRALNDLGGLLDAISELRRASAAPDLEGFDAADVIANAVRRETRGRGCIEIQRAGPSPFPIVTGKALFEMIISNGLRNAIEATEEVDPEVRKAIVVTWGRSRDGCFFAILDEGAGLTSSAEHAFEIGKTTKVSHYGMGLPAARHAAASLDAKLELLPGAKGGARYELRIPGCTEAKS